RPGFARRDSRRPRDRDLPIEDGKGRPLASTGRFFTGGMTGVPSIMFGLFIYITLVVTKVGGAGFAAAEGPAPPGAPRAPDRQPLVRGGAPPGSGRVGGGGPGARRAAMEGDLEGSHPDGPARHRHRLAARGRSRRRRDGAPAAGAPDRPTDDLQPQRPDE